VKAFPVPQHGFLIGLLATVGLAFLLPQFGAAGGPLRTELTTQLGVVVIFLLQGLLLRTEELWRDLRHWRLHGFVQGYGFVVIPALVLVADLIGGHWLAPELRMGFLFLAILPTTIATATVFTTQAGGSVAGAVFNTAVSNVLGIFLVPVWTAWVLATTLGRSVAVWPMLQKIILLLLLPLVVGQVLRPWLKGLAEPRRRAIGRINSGIVFFIVYAAFCNSVVSGLWQEQGIGVLAIVVVLVAVLLAAVMLLAWGLLRVLRFNRADTIAGLFCGTQKTLAAGVPMAESIFGGVLVANGTAGGSALGLILLPLLWYHVLQLLVGGWLVGRWSGNRGEAQRP